MDGVFGWQEMNEESECIWCIKNVFIRTVLSPTIKEKNGGGGEKGSITTAFCTQYIHIID
jgi:hypothetical protein